MPVNRNLVLVVGKPTTGKSASLMYLDKPEGVLYLNTEAGKELPFPAKFQQVNITHPNQIPKYIKKAEKVDDIHTIVIDSLTYMMDMVETIIVHDEYADNTMKGWSEYNQFFKRLLQQTVAGSSKNIIFTAHTKDEYNEKEMRIETKVPVKGALRNNGVESYFCNVIAAKRITLNHLEQYESDLLQVTPDDEMLGYKHVFQTRLTRDTVNEALRGPIGMWQVNETFIDNNMQNVLNHLQAYYK